MTDHIAIAQRNGWTETPDGRWWREIENGETIVNGDRIEFFCGSGPYLFADSAEDVCLADNL
jgi:hypothetical protein